MSSFFLSPRTVKAAGLALIGASLSVLGWRYIVHQRHTNPPVAESRLSPRLKSGEGAWWYTGAPAPPDQRPDLTGMWFGGSMGDFSEAAIPGGELRLTLVGKQRYATVDYSKNPTGMCLPPGPSRIMLMMTPVMIVQRPDVVLILSESHRTYRIIYTDGRGHDPEVKDYPEWMGSSIGSWDGDTLVVDTIAVKDRTWLDYLGHEHSDQLHLTEKLRLTDRNTLEHIITYDDPIFFEKPVTTRRLLQRQIGDRILDNACMENEKDFKNLVPTIGDEGR